MFTWKARVRREVRHLFEEFDIHSHWPLCKPQQLRRRERPLQAPRQILPHPTPLPNVSLDTDVDGKPVGNS